MTDAVKFIEEDDGWFIEGLIMPFGGVTTNGQDLTGTHFTPNTDYCKEWFPDGGRPGMYGHGFDATLGLSVIGREVKSWKDDKGVWLRAQIDKAHAYAAEIKELVEKGLLSLSSGAVDHLVRVAAKSGEILVWPYVEWSMVPNPAHPGAALYQVKSTDAILHIEAEGTVVPEPVLAIRDSSAAWDASMASNLRASLTDLMGNETDDTEQMRLLRACIGYLDRFIASETDEIGTPADQIETATDEAEMYGWLSKDRAFLGEAGIKSILTPQSLHDAAIASGAHCASEAVHSEPVLSISEAVPEPVDLAAIRAETSAAAVRAVKERLGL